MSKAPPQVAGRRRVDGVYELGHALHVLDGEVHSFAASDIERVERFWTFGDMHTSSAGFVLCLRDGRRAYLDFQHWHAFEQDEDFRIDTEFLDGGTLPTFASPDEPLGGWSDETTHLNKVFAG
jgi:hypothetical protein